MKKLIAIIPLIALIQGCVTGQLITADTMVQNFEIAENKDTVFDAALTVAQLQNLDVSVLEKDSGLIRFEAASLSAGQLDQYCEYPAINPTTGQPWDTFQNWNIRSTQGNMGQVRGRVSITLLISEEGIEESNVNMRSNWTAFNSTESNLCNSTGVLEREYIAGIRAHLAN